MQFDVVESTAIHVESLDSHRHIPCFLLAVVGALGVYHPVVAWRAHLHFACRWDEVCGEVGCEHTLCVFWIHQTDTQVLIVEVFAWIYGDFLCEHIHLACIVNNGVEHDICSCAGERCTIHTNFCPLRVASGRQEVVEHHCRPVGIVCLVGDVQDETCRLVGRHIRLYRLFNPDAWIVGRNGCYIEHGAWLVPLGRTLSLVRLAGHSANGAEYEIGVNFRIGG